MLLILYDAVSGHNYHQSPSLEKLFVSIAIILTY